LPQIGRHAAAAWNRIAAPHRPLFEFLAYTGLRIGETLGLTWSDIDFDAGLIRVHRQLSMKEGRLSSMKERAVSRVWSGPSGGGASRAL
jgi:integrase